MMRHRHPMNSIRMKLDTLAELLDAGRHVIVAARRLIWSLGALLLSLEFFVRLR